MIFMEDKKKRGRPGKDGSRRNKLFSRCNDYEKADIERAARISEVSVSEFIRMIVHEASVKVINEREQKLAERFGGNNIDIYDCDCYEEEVIDDYLN